MTEKLLIFRLDFYGKQNVFGGETSPLMGAQVPETTAKAHSSAGQSLRVKTDRRDFRLRLQAT